MIISDGSSESAVQLKRLFNGKFSVVAGLFLLLSLIGLNDVLVYNPDSARYLIWARSLADFKGFLDTSILEPFHYVVHAPLYSLLLAPGAFIFSGSIIAVKLLTVFSGLLLLFLFFQWLRGSTTDGFAALGCLILALNPLMVLFSNQILSDVPFGVILILAFLLARRMGTKSDGGSKNILLLAFVISAGILLREVGITLWIAVVVFFGARKEYSKAGLVFLFPLLFYLLWFWRNEILVAGAEHPPLRNSEIFTLHYLTDRSSSLASELVARFRMNFSIYWSQIVNLVWLPQYGTAPYGVINQTTPPYSIIAGLGRTVFGAVAVAGLGAFFYGVLLSWKKDPSTPLFLAFAPVYLLLIFFYPFNDVRFLFPLLLFMTYFSILGVEGTWGLLSRRFAPSRVKIFMSAVILLFLLPNAFWCFAYARDNAAYRSDPQGFYATVAGSVTFPDMLTKPTAMVGSWLRKNGMQDVVVLTQWKELTFWHEGKLVEMNSLVPLDEFERNIRDNSIGVIVSAVGLAGIPEFYAQMVLSRRYGFRSVYRVANLELFVVLHEPGSFSVAPLAEYPESPAGIADLWQEHNRYRSQFSRGLEALTRNRIDNAIASFDSLAAETNGASTAVLYLAIAKEFQGEFGRARQLLGGLQQMRQSGAFLGHSTYHQEIIDLLESAAKERSPVKKAELLHVASIKYWNLGFHSKAMQMLDEALAVEPSFPPGLVFGVYFSLERNDLNGAVEFLRRLRQAAPGHPLVEPFSRIIALEDSAGRLGPRADWDEAKATEYLKAGLGDSAIDELLEAIELEPTSTEARMALARIYESKGRYWPALNTLQQGRRLDHEDKAVVEMIGRLEQKW